MIHFLSHGFGQFNKNHFVGPAKWPHFDLLYIHEGRVELQTADRESHFQMEGGDSILVYPDTYFEGRALSPSAWASIQHFAFQPAREEVSALPTWHDQVNQTEFFQNRKNTEVAKDISRAIELSRVEESQGIQETREALLFLILAQLRTIKASRSTMTAEQQVFEEARTWALAHLKNSVTIEKMAAVAGLSSSHFRARFKEYYGEPAGKFLLRNRIYRARELLRETRMPIKQISRETGYANVIPFHQAFLKHTGKTPAQYRKDNALKG